MNIFDKLFHTHTWKVNKEEFIRAENALTHNCEYKFYVQYQECLVCSKKRLFERKKLFVRED